MEIYTGTFNKDTVHRCSNCNTSLSSETEYKEHYKTEFHRYNLKRRSVNLPPATIEQFNAKKASDSAKAGAPEEKHCDRCKYISIYLASRFLRKRHINNILNLANTSRHLPKQHHKGKPNPPNRPKNSRLTLRNAVYFVGIRLLLLMGIWPICRYHMASLFLNGSTV